jgi:hypothetical protein
MLKLGNWSPAYKRFLLAYDEELSQTAQAVIVRGREVPAKVLTAARQAVKNIPVLQRLIRKAKNTAELNASTQRTDFISLFGSVLGVIEYVGEQCGSTQEGSMQMGKATIVTQGTGQTVAGTSTARP